MTFWINLKYVPRAPTLIKENHLWLDFGPNNLHVGVKAVDMIKVSTTYCPDREKIRHSKTHYYFSKN